MKASELRIGNKIKFMDDGTIFTVVSIDLKGAGLENTDEFAWIEFESLEPIPLTEEWLLKLGFKKEEIQKYSDGRKPEMEYVNGILMMIRGSNNMFSAAPYGYPMNPRLTLFVHQLQNLYYALTGEELTLTEP